MNLTEYLNYCKQYNGIKDESLIKRDKAVKILINDFGFKVANISRNFIQLFKIAGDGVLWVIFNYSDKTGGEFYTNEGEKSQLVDFLKRPRLIQNDNVMIAEAGEYQFHKMKGEQIISVYQKENENLVMLDCYESLAVKDDYLSIKRVCEAWLSNHINQAEAV